jgi:cobalamin biosynthesis Co2+ chelatase CbiK
MNSSDIKEDASSHSRESIRNILKSKGVPEEKMEKEVDKIYAVIDIFFDHWTYSVQKNHEPANKKTFSNILQG